MITQMNKKLNILTIFWLILIFLDFGFEDTVKYESFRGIGVALASESSDILNLGLGRKKKHSSTVKLPNYPKPGMRYDDDSDLNVEKKKSRKSKHKDKKRESSSSESGGNGDDLKKDKKKRSKDKKDRSKKKHKDILEVSPSIDVPEFSDGSVEKNLDSLAGKKPKIDLSEEDLDKLMYGRKTRVIESSLDRDIYKFDMKPKAADKSKHRKSKKMDKSKNTNKGLEEKSTRKRSSKSTSKNSMTTPSSSSDSDDKKSAADFKMKYYKSFYPGVNDLIWQDPKERKTYKHLNSQHGDYYPKIATKPYREVSECASLFDSAKKAYEKREIRINPMQFTGLALPFARKLSHILQQYVNLQDSCLMLRMLLHIYSGMRTRAQFINIIAAVTQNDVLLGRISDKSDILKQVNDLLDSFLQLPKHRADSKSKQLSAIQLIDFFYLSVFPKDNSYESRLFPAYRKLGEDLKRKIEEKLGIFIARDEVMSMIYILLNFIEKDRTTQQCSEIILAVIGATYFNALTSSQLKEIDRISRDILSCTESGVAVMNRDQIMEIFGPETSIVEMRQKTLKGLPVSDSVRIWKEIGGLDYLGRVISVQFNDCNGLKAWQLNRLCSMMEIMNRRLIKTGTIKDLITIEELCGAHRYKAKHSGTKWTIAIKATLQQRSSQIPVKIEKLFSHFLNHEKRKLSVLEGSVKRKRENFYSIPEFSGPTYIETVIPKSHASGIPSRELTKPDHFYAFNSQPNWVQNRFLFLAAFIEELLLHFGYFTHISPVNLFNNLGGLINDQSDLSQVLRSLKLNSSQISSILKAFINYEKKLFNLNNSRSSDKMDFLSFIEALYEYPIARYIEGRYFIETAINFESELESILSNDFEPLVTSNRMSRIFNFQGFINNRLKVHTNEENLNFMTTEEAYKILSNCVNYSKMSLIVEMKKILSPQFFSDSLINLLAGEWTEYEDFVIPEVLDLVPSLGSNYIEAIYSQNIRLSVLGIDGWELLIDPSITLRNIVNNINNRIIYSITPILSVTAALNRSKFIFNWLQLYFIYKLFKIPTFNLSEIQSILDSLPLDSNLGLEEMIDLIGKNKELKISREQIELLSNALLAYFFYEKYFIVGRSSDLNSVFETNQLNIIQGRLNIPNVIWDFISIGTSNYISEIEDQNTIYFADTVLAYLSKMFTTDVTNQNLFLEIIRWSINLDLNDDSIFMASSLRIQDFIGYLKKNSRLHDLKTSFLVPWVDHTSSGYVFRRQVGLPHISSPGYSPLEGPSDVQEVDGRVKVIISQIERLSMEYKTLLLEFNNQIVQEDYNNEVIEKIKTDIQNLLAELNTISSNSVGIALQFLTDKRLVPMHIFQLQENELSTMGIQINENGDLVFMPTQMQTLLTGLYTPSLNLGMLDVNTGDVLIEGLGMETVCSTQIINRMQAFRIWWGSVFHRMPYLCSDPFISSDLQNISILLPIFVKIGYKVDSNAFATFLSVIATNYPYLINFDVFESIASTFISDERKFLNFLSPVPKNLQEAYKDLRMIGKFLQFKGTLPMIGVPNIFTFIPSVEVVDYLKQDSSYTRNNIGNAKINLLNLIERLTAEYYASPPRNMPTIGIPRLNNLAINFSNNLDHLIFLITSIFGERSHYISAPSIGASAFHLAEYILRHIPFKEAIDNEYINSEFHNTHLAFGSPLEQIKNKDFSAFGNKVNFKWTNLYFYLNSKLFGNSLSGFSELISYASEYLSRNYDFWNSVNLSQQIIDNIAYSFVFGQNLLEIVRVNIDLSSLEFDNSKKNEILNIFSKAVSFLISYIEPYHTQTENLRIAENLFTVVSSDLFTRKFYGSNVRHEMVNRWSFFVSLGSDKIRSLFLNAKNELFSRHISVSKSFESSIESVNQRYQNQISDLTVINNNFYITKTPICNLILSFGYFASKVLEIQQNNDKVGLGSLIIGSFDIWSSACGLSDFDLLDYHTVIISTLRNFLQFNGPPMQIQHLNSLRLLIDFFDQNIRNIILTSNNEYDQNTSNEVLFSDLAKCIIAITKFFQSNLVIIDDLQMSNADQLRFNDPFNSRHFGLNTVGEISVSRVQKRGLIESLFFSTNYIGHEFIFSSGYNQIDSSRQISKDQFLDTPIKEPDSSNNTPLKKLPDLLSKYSISLSLPSLNTKCEGKYCSYLNVRFPVNDEVYRIENSFLDGKKVLNTNRAVFFLFWWLIIWEKLPFYSNDFVLGELNANIEFLSDVFDQVGLVTIPGVIFKPIYSKIMKIFPGYSSQSHLYLIIDAFLDSESKAMSFTGTRDIELAYKNYGMLNALNSFEHKIPDIPIPRETSKISALSIQNTNNLSQYLFRIISEYFAASPRLYPTILIPSTSFLAENFSLNKDKLTYLLYLWSNMNSENSIKSFFEAPTIGASYEGLADYIMENFQLNFLRFDQDFENFFSDSNFNKFFKFGSPISRVVNIEIDHFCKRRSCGPFVFKFPNRNLLIKNLTNLVQKCFDLTINKAGIHQSSEINKQFSPKNVVVSLLNAVNILDAVRIHGFEKQDLQVNYAEFNKFCLLFSLYYARIFSKLLNVYYVPHSSDLTNELSFKDISGLLGRSLNILNQFLSEIGVISFLDTDDLQEFIEDVYLDDINVSENYEAFYGIATTDASRGLMTVYTNNMDAIHLQITHFNYIYCYILFLMHILVENNSKLSSFPTYYYHLLNYDSIVKVTEIARRSGIPESVSKFLIQGNQLANHDLKLEKLTYVHKIYHDHANKIFNGALWSAFSSYKNLKNFIISLSYLSNSVQFELDYLQVDSFDLFPPAIFTYYSPKSQSLQEEATMDSILNDNSLRDYSVHSNNQVSTITGLIIKPWVPTIYFYDNYILNLSVASNDNLAHFDPGNIYLKRKIKRTYLLNANLDLSSNFNSIIDLGTAEVSTGIIRGSQIAALNGLDIGILNRAVLFREWFIHLWGLSREIYRDPVIYLFLNNFESILNIFKRVGYNDPILLYSSISHILLMTSGIRAEKFLLRILELFSEFESTLILDTGFDSLEAASRNGVGIYLLRSLPMKNLFPVARGEIKKEVWKVNDSAKRANLLDYLTHKLTDYFSHIPRSAISFTLPDVSILLDNYSKLPSFKYVIEKWAEDRLDLISAPFLGLDPDSIHEFISDTLDSINIADFDTTKLVHGFLDEFPTGDSVIGYYSKDLSLRQYDSVYNDLVIPLETANLFGSAAGVLKVIAANVLDVYRINYYESVQNKNSKNSGNRYNDFSDGLKYEIFLKRIVLGVSEIFAARKLFGVIYSIHSPSDLNKIVSDFLKKFSVIKNCIYNSNYEYLEYNNINSDIKVALKKMGIYLTEGEITTLHLNYVFVKHSSSAFFKKTFISDCLNNYHFYKRSAEFSTMPELGVVSQLDGVILGSFGNYEGDLIGTYVPKINLLLFYLNSLNTIINQSNNKILLGISASINFVQPSIVSRLSRCKLRTHSGFSCIANELLNCMIELDVDVGNMTSEILSQVIESLNRLLGEMSFSSYPELDAEFMHNDPIQNRKYMKDNPIQFNPNKMNELLGNYELMKRIIQNRFGFEFVDLRDLSASAALLPQYTPVKIEINPLFKINLLDDIPAYTRNTGFNARVINYDDYLNEMGYSISSITSFFPILSDIAIVHKDFIQSKEASFPNISIQLANRAALFYIFTQVSTHPYSRINTITLLECMQFFAKYNHIDISLYSSELSVIFKNVEFYKIFQLLDAFYTFEKIIFSLDDGRVPNSEYLNLKKLNTILIEFGPIPLDLEIPYYNGNTLFFGKFICLFAKRFFDKSIHNEFSASTCDNIARILWPKENKRISNYIVVLTILEYVPSTRSNIRLVKEFATMLDWYLYTKIGSTFDFESETFETFYKMSFSKPFVCKESDLPWFPTRNEFNDVTFAQFNFLMFISAAWNQFILEKNLKFSSLTNSDLMTILNSLSFGISLISTTYFRPTFIKKGDPSRISVATEHDLTNSEIDLLKTFFREIQRYWRIRHQGVIDVSFRWPSIDCDAQDVPFVPGLSFPLILNSDSVEITSLGELL